MTTLNLQDLFCEFLNDLSNSYHPDHAREIIASWEQRKDLGEALSAAKIEEDFDLFAVTDKTAPRSPGWKKAQFRVIARKVMRRYEASQCVGIPGYGIF